MERGKLEIDPRRRHAEAIKKDMDKTKESIAKASVAIKTAGRSVSV